MGFKSYGILLPADMPDKKKDQANHQEKEEQEFGNPRRRSSDTGNPKSAAMQLSRRSMPNTAKNTHARHQCNVPAGTKSRRA
jgi:hypothetical protein